MAKRNTDFSLTSIDDLFSTEEERENGKMPRIKDVPLFLLDDFPNHPFKVRFDDDMMQLVDSVSERGVLTPALVREKENGRYELISVHRRKKASELNQLNYLRCVILDISDEDAAIIMVDSNIQRTNIPPSELAKAYKIRYDAMEKKQGRRTDLTSSQLETKLRTDEKLATELGVSRAKVQRYMRLNYLVPELLEYVDEGKIKMTPAVELSYLDEDCQRDLVDYIDDNESTPSHAQAIRLHKLFKEGKLTREVIYCIMDEDKPNQKEKVVIRGERFERLIPKSIPINQREDFVCKALEYYNNFLNRQKNRDSR